MIFGFKISGIPRPYKICCFGYFTIHRNFLSKGDFYVSCLTRLRKNKAFDGHVVSFGFGWEKHRFHDILSLQSSGKLCYSSKVIVKYKSMQSEQRLLEPISRILMDQFH